MILPLKIGITGGIGAGKSLVCKVLENMGYPVFYSDQAAKILMNTQPGLKNDLIQLLGDETYENGELNRVYIAKRVFEDKTLLDKMNALIHPEVRNAFQQFVEENRNSLFVFNEAAILFETGAYKTFDKTILVAAPEELRIDRVMNRDNVSEDQVLARMKNQWRDEQKIPLAHFVINNDEKSSVVQQIERILNQLTQSIEC